jgi:hypothetical protein
MRFQKKKQFSTSKNEISFFQYFFKKPILFTCRRIFKLLAEPDIQPFINRLSTNNHKNNREIVPRTLQHNPRKNKKIHTHLGFQLKFRADLTASCLLQVAPSVSNTPINSMKKISTAAISFAN